MFWTITWLFTTTTTFQHTVTTLSLHNQISTSSTTSLQHLTSLLPPKIIIFCYFILNSARNKFHWFKNYAAITLPIHGQYNSTPRGGGYYCFPTTFLDPFCLPVWRHIIKGKSLGSLVQISKGFVNSLRLRSIRRELISVRYYCSCWLIVRCFVWLCLQYFWMQLLF